MTEMRVSTAEPVTVADLLGTGTGQVPVRVGQSVLTASVLDDLVDQWGMQSFPASDPPAHW